MTTRESCEKKKRIAWQSIRFGCHVMLVMIFLVFASILAQAQGPFINPVCKENCALTNGACILREQTCQLNLNAYNNYMWQLSLGVQPSSLPPLYVELLQKYYSADLSKVLFGFSDRQPGAKATTDCSVMYFSSLAPTNFVTKLKDGKLTTDQEFRLLLHELRHVNQCKIIGGRDAYAKMWFGHLNVSLQKIPLSFKELHDGMPMEADAISAASDLLTKISVIRDRTGMLVRPLLVDVLAGNTVLGDSMTVFAGVPTHFTARVPDGYEPLMFWWSVRRPYRFFPESLNNGRTDQKEIDWTPDRTGDYVISLSVTQPESTLARAGKTIKVIVIPRPTKSTATTSP